MFFSESTLASGCIECMESGKASHGRQPCREPLQAVQPRCGIASDDLIFFVASWLFLRLIYMNNE